MHAEDLWNHQQFFDYVDRWMTENDAPAVATIKSATGLDYSADWERQGQAWDPFVDDMWAKYRNNLPQTGVTPPGGSPLDFVLYQNFPNPFNPGTTIQYRVPVSSRVTLTLFDLLGQPVATLVDGVESPGLKSVRFQAGSLASGVYYCRLRAGDYTETRKLILEK